MPGLWDRFGRNPQDPYQGAQGSDPLLRNPYFQGVSPAEGYQGRTLDLYANILPTVLGMNEYYAGGRYDPQGQWTTNLASQMVGETPMMQAASMIGSPNMRASQMWNPSASAAAAYGRQAGDLASRAGALSMGSALNQLSERVTNPAALAAMAGQLNVSTSANAAGAAAQGFGAGMQALTTTGVQNLLAQREAGMANFTAMQDRNRLNALLEQEARSRNQSALQQSQSLQAGISSGLASQALGQLGSMQQLQFGTIADSIMNQQNQRYQRRAEQRARMERWLQFGASNAPPAPGGQEQEQGGSDIMRTLELLAMVGG